MYNHKVIEKNIREFWEKNDTYHFDVYENKPKSYILDMFPYPSGQGLHVGHPKGYTSTDAYSRYKRFRGFNVLHPIGWDAFGLPAEQYAISTGNHPEDFTQKNIDVFRKQLKSLGFSFDYKKEVDTTDSKYYKWTQWIFSKLFENNLAEIKDIDVNWCEGLKTVLANEEILIVNGKMVSERGEFPVVKKPMRQWVLKITEYADKLLEGLNELDWPESLKTMQRAWIGKSQGTDVDFLCGDIKLEVFTTRVDTLYGVSFLAIAPENINTLRITTKENLAKVKKYIDLTKSKTILQRQEEKEKTGVFTGAYAVNPVNGKKVPVYTADYVLNDYAHGIVMGVASADERDYEFAIKNNLPIIPIIEGKDKCITTDGKHINSELINGLYIKESIKKINDFLVKKGCAKITTNYKLKNWIFSRQRYWGEPFPIIFDKNNVPHLDTKLPLLLPKLKDFQPSDDGQLPLAKLKDWLVVEKNNQKFTRETNTMPQWAGSCWYYLAYLMKKDDGSYRDLNSSESFEIFKKWLPVDLYVGGQEHAVLHLLYARFWHRFLYDIKVVSAKEPFYKIINQGMILGPNGEKMSKSKGNVINPNEIVELLGADTLRVYEMFMGPLTATLAWNDESLHGSRKWLERVYNWYHKQDLVITKNIKEVDRELIVSFHKMIKNITNMIENHQYNVAISQMMIYLNECHKYKTMFHEHYKSFLVILSIFAPFLAEHLFHKIENNTKISVTKEVWPSYEEKYLVNDQVLIPIQINGKLRDTITVNININQDELISLALQQPKIKVYVENQKIIKTIFVKGKILNLII